jgi:DNA-binding LytR/AlgR family response regulator
MILKNCIVLDDEQHSIEILSEYIEKSPNLNLLKAFKNPLDAISFIQSNEIDIAFIDVQMPNLTGLEFLKLLKPSTKVILCTAYSEYAIEGFELNVVDYLLKPISFERFLRSIQKLSNVNTQPVITNTNNSTAEFIFVKTEAKGKLIKVMLNNILFIEGLGNYQKIKTIDSVIICQLKMKTIEEQLGQHGFVRVHKSFLVPIDKISQIEGNKISIGNDKIPIGESFKADLFEILKGKILD